MFQFSVINLMLGSGVRYTWQYQGHILAPSDRAAFLFSECRMLNQPVFENTAGVSPSEDIGMYAIELMA